MTIQDDKHEKQLKAFRKLDESWRQNQLAATTPDLYKEITKKAIATVQLDLAKELDPDLASLKEQVKMANEPYSEGRKTNSLSIRFLVDVLKGRGENVPSIEDFLSAAAKEVLSDKE